MRNISINDVAIVTPIYSRNIKPGEKISLQYLDKFLNKFDKYFIAPQDLIKGSINRKGYKIIRFDKSFFANRNSYNKLLLEKEFYESFSKYKYILIYQLDALVFSDQLLRWCNRGYDYIAAPWFDTKIGHLTNRKGSPISGGNGGFSLRNVQKSLKVLDLVEKSAIRSSENTLIQKIWLASAIITGKSHGKWLNAPADNYPFNEDGFWSLEAPKYLTDYKVAPFEEALSFSFEKYPRKCFELTNRRLPFGTHAWEKYDRAFWLQILSV